MKKLCVLLLTLLALGISAFAIDANIGVIDMRALVSQYKGMTQAQDLFNAKRTELSAITIAANGIALPADDFRNYRLLVIKTVPSQTQKDEIAAYEAKAKVIVNELNAMQVRINEDPDNVSEQEKIDFEAKVQNYIANEKYVRDQIDINSGRLQKYSQDLDAVIQTQFSDAVKKVAGDKKLNMVLTKSANLTERYEDVVLWSAPEADITVDVVNYLNSIYTDAMFSKIVVAE